MKNKKKIIFITLITIFVLIWLASLVLLGLSNFSESTRTSIETWYANRSEEGKTLNLTKVTMWMTFISTIAILLTLLANEIKKKYR